MSFLLNGVKYSLGLDQTKNLNGMIEFDKNLLKDRAPRVASYMPRGASKLPENTFVIAFILRMSAKTGRSLY